jgi:phosphatidylserine/phosphatidylglycerophosphate/cardiolipin synthase-like enzyme
MSAVQRHHRLRTREHSRAARLAATTSKCSRKNMTHQTRTGSFNFTAFAEKSNAENVLVLHDASIAVRYAAEWDRL